MNLDDIRTIKERLQSEYNTNLKKINTLQSKIFILKANTLDNKLLVALAISLFICVFTPFTIRLLDTMIPRFLFQPFLIGIPLTIGVVSQQVLYRKWHQKELLHSFSSAHNEKEKVFEIANFTIEKEKLIRQNQILTSNLDFIDAVEQTMQNWPPNYYVNFEKSFLNQGKGLFQPTDDEKRYWSSYYSIYAEKNLPSQENAQKQFETVNKNLKELEQDLNLIVTQATLSHLFNPQRDKITNWASFLGLATIALGTFFFTNFPSLLFYPTSSTLLPFLETFIPIVLGGITISGYFLKRKRDYLSVFYSINNNLGNKGLSRYESLDEKKIIEQNLEHTLSRYATEKLYAETLKQELEAISKENEFKKQSSEMKRTVDREQIDTYAVEASYSLNTENEPFSRKLTLPK